MGVSHEELLLEETSSREQVLLGTINDLETQLRSTRQVLERVANEKVNSFCLCKFHRRFFKMTVAPVMLNGILKQIGSVQTPGL